MAASLVSRQHQILRMVSQLRPAPVLAETTGVLPGTKAMRQSKFSLLVSGAPVRSVASLWTVSGRYHIDHVCGGRGAWESLLRRSNATNATTQTRTGEGVVTVPSTANASSSPSPPSTSGSSSTSASSLAAASGSIRLPVHAFANASDDENQTSSTASTIDLPADIFGQPLRRDILHRVVRWQLARRQQGTHKTKTRSEVRGGGRKPWQQKGSGRARQGTIRAAQWRGGGIVHGPVVRSHAHGLPKKVRRLGLAVAVSAKLEEGRLVVVDGLGRETNGKNTRDEEGSQGDTVVKTQEMLKRIDGLLGRAEVPVTRRSVLMVDGTDGVPVSVGKSTRNIPWVDVIPVMGLNVYSILQRDVLVMTTEAVEGLVTRLHTPIKR